MEAMDRDDAAVDTAPAPLSRLTGQSGGADGFLGGAGEGGSEFEKRSPVGGAFVLGVVVLVAGGALFAMRQAGIGPRISFADMSIDYPLDEHQTSAIDGTHDQIIEDLQNSGVTVQVPLARVRQDPFTLAATEVAESAPVVVAPVTDPAEQRRREREARKLAIERALGNLHLNTIIGGTNPIVRISGRTLTIGDTVGEYFVVRAIHGRSVDLEADGELYTLSMGSP